MAEFKSAPPIDTARLALRAHTVEDFADCAALWGNADVVRYIGGVPSTPEATWARLLRYAGHWTLLGYGYWAIRDRATHAFLGEVGFADHHRDVTPALEPPECGWVLAPAAHGRGLATEAVRGILEWADARGWRRTTAMIDPGNTSSLRVAEKCGFERFASATYLGDSTIRIGRASCRERV